MQKKRSVRSRENLQENFLQQIKNKKDIKVSCENPLNNHKMWGFVDLKSRRNIKFPFFLSKKQRV